MSVDLHKNNDIHVSEMEDGQLAEVTDWDDGALVGKVVQRYKDILIVIGEDSGEAYSNICTANKLTYPRYKVRLLEPGEVIEVCTN